MGDVDLLPDWDPDRYYRWQNRTAGSDTVSEHELLRFTPKKLSARQVSHLLAIVNEWHGVHVDVVGDDQIGIVGPDQRHDILIEAKGVDNGQYL